MEEQKPELLRFLLVNESDIQTSKLFEEYEYSKKLEEQDSYIRFKEKHLKNLLNIIYLEKLLADTEDTLSEPIVIEKYVSGIKDEKAGRICEIAKKYDVNANLISEIIKLFSKIQCEECNKKEENLLLSMYRALSMNDSDLYTDISKMLDRELEVKEEQLKIQKKKQDLMDKRNAIKSLQTIRECYVETLGFEEKYVKPEYKKAIEHLKETLDIIANLNVANEAKDISKEVIVEQFKQDRVKEYIKQFALINYAKKYRVSGDKAFIEKFSKNVEDHMMVPYKKDDKVQRENIGKFLIKYRNYLGKLYKSDILFDMELDIESEYQKIKRIIDKYCEFVTEKMDKKKENGEDSKKEDNLKAKGKVAKEEIKSSQNKKTKITPTINASKEDSEEEEKSTEETIQEEKICLLKRMKDRNEYKAFIKDIEGLQLNKIYDLTEELVNKEKQEEAYVSDGLDISVRDSIERLRTLNEDLQRQFNKEIQKRINSNKPNNRNSDEAEKKITNSVEEKNHFYICKFNENIGIMTFPYANIEQGANVKRYSRAAILIDVEDMKYISNTNRGASWASGANDRVKRGEKRIYSGKNLSINNNTIKLINVIDRKEAVKQKNKPYLKSHKFDYRRSSTERGNSDTIKEQENKYYPIEEIPWITDNNMDISQYKAVCYIPSAFELKEFIEDIVKQEAEQKAKQEAEQKVKQEAEQKVNKEVKQEI